MIEHLRTIAAIVLFVVVLSGGYLFPIIFWFIIGGMLMPCFYMMYWIIYGLVNDGYKKHVD
jgi:hypothetical protein